MNFPEFKDFRKRVVGGTFSAPVWGPSGEAVYARTYSRTMADGTKETWWDTVNRVVDGNLGLVDSKYIEDDEREKLVDMMYSFKILPAGRHLWTSGIARTFPMNCWVSGWGDKLSDHYAFTFARLMEGGGVGANYSTRFVGKYEVKNGVDLEIVCNPEHADYADLQSAGVLSDERCWEASTPNIQVEDSREGWAAALADLINQATDVDFRDDVLVIDVSNIRKSGTKIKSFGGTSAGPVPFAKMLHKVADILNGVHSRRREDWQETQSWPILKGWTKASLTPLDAMEIDHAIAECVVAGNVRRSARMSIVEWDDPYIMQFIRCKADTQSHWSTNISVGVNQDFFDDLVNPEVIGPNGPTFAIGNTPYRRSDAILQSVAEGMLSNGEPGFVNLTMANHGEVEEVSASNPCQEIFLQDYEPCNLGHVNLDAFHLALPFWSFAYDPNEDDEGHPTTVAAYDLIEAHRLMARFLIRATFAGAEDPKSREVLSRNRRIGVGEFGFAGMLAKNGIRYSESYRRTSVREMLKECSKAVRDEARRYAFELRIPEPIKTTAIAPTGTIAKLPGATEGAHPVFYRHFLRRIRFSTVDPDQASQLAEYEAQGYRVEDDLYSANTRVVELPTEDPLVGEVRALGIDPAVVESTDEISARDKLGVLTMYQECYADNSVSYTVNLQPDELTTEELSRLLAEHLPNAKGISVFPAISRPQAPYERISESEYEATTARSVDDSYSDECQSGSCPVR